MGYICGRMGAIFTDLLNFENTPDLDNTQKEILKDVINIYGCALTFGKYAIDKLVDYKYLLDENFIGDQKELYTNELAFQEKVEEYSKQLISNDAEWLMPDESLYKDQPYISWKKGYDILYVYATGYKLLKRLYDISIKDEHKEAIQGIINTTMASYYMAGRITNKMNEYNEQLKDTDFDDKFYTEHTYDIELSTKEFYKHVKEIIASG